MKLDKLSAVAAFVCVCALASYGQAPPTIQVIPVASAPVGQCTNPALELDLSTGNLWSCAAVWNINPNTGQPNLVSPGTWTLVTGTGVNCTVNGSLLYFFAGVPCDTSISTDGNGHLTMLTASANSYALTGAGAGVWTVATGTGVSAPSAGNATYYVDSVSNLFTCLLPGSISCMPSSSLGTVTYTSSHTAGTADNGKLVIFNCSSACALTLPNPQPSTTWKVSVMTIGSSVATVTLGSSITYNAGSSVPVLNSFRIMGVSANSATSTDYEGEAPLVAGSGLTATAAANGFTLALATALPNGTTATTQTAGDNSTKVATTAYVNSYAPLASPTFTGTPASPTASANTNTTQLATTAYADRVIAAPLLTGNSSTNSVHVGSSDFTTTSASLVAITGLSWTLPASTAANYAFQCHISFSEATSSTATSFGIQDVTTAPTNIQAHEQVMQSSTSPVTANITNLTTTTATPFGNATPTSTSVLSDDIYGMIEQPSGSASVFQIMADIASGITLTVKRDSYCSLNVSN